MTRAGESIRILIVKLVKVFFEDNFSEKSALSESKSAFKVSK
jgi:hypothetical protein